MADTIAALRSGGILIPEVMVHAAGLERVELAVAAAILEGESSGGRNVWGHDGVSTGGIYTKGSAVTRDTYLRYRDAMRAKRIGRQGVGPCQATSAQYQDVADALGGCWDPLPNCRSGFRGMGALIRSHGVRGGARRYNGSGPAAEKYADRFMGRYERWRARLAGASAPVPSGGGARPTLRRGATGPLVGSVIRYANATFPAYDMTPIPLLDPPLFGPGTEAFVREFQRRTGLGADGVIGPQTWAMFERNGYRG